MSKRNLHVTIASGDSFGVPPVPRLRLNGAASAAASLDVLLDQIMT